VHPQTSTISENMAMACLCIMAHIISEIPREVNMQP
jgi:hypothetical protein